MRTIARWRIEHSEAQSSIGLKVRFVARFIARFMARCLAAGLLLFSCASIADVTEINNESLAKLQADGAIIIDVRRAEEWEATGMVEGSHPLTFFDANGKYDALAWVTALNEIAEKDQPIVLICATGVRSSKIAGLLDKRLGFSAVHNVTDGIMSWISDNNPVVSYP